MSWSKSFPWLAILTCIFSKKFCIAIEKDVIFGVPQPLSSSYFDSNSTEVKFTLNEANILIAVQTLQNDGMQIKVGRVKGLRITWSEWTGFLERFGTAPSLSVDRFNNTVIMFESNSSLYYQTGRLENTPFGIRWNQAFKHEDHGKTPSVALAGIDGSVLECHNRNRTIIYCTTCKIDNTALVCRPAVPLVNGTNVTVGSNAKRNVIEVHLHEYTIWYTIGVTDDNGIITWGETTSFNEGSIASVSLNDNDQVFLVWEKDDHEVRYSTGHLIASNKSVLWYSDRKAHGYEGSNYFSLGANSDVVILYSDKGLTTSLIRNRKRWIELTPGVLDKALWQLTLPGSHDAGAYKLMDFRVKEGCKKAPDFIPGFIIKLYSETQNENFQEQLENGVRYFDVRPYYWPSSEGGTNDFHAYHDNIGSRISRILYLTKTFLDSVQKEFIILRFSHFCSTNFNNQLHERLTRSIRSILGNYILELPATGILTTPMKILLEAGPRALVIYDHDFASNHEDLGFLRHRPYFDKYSNTDRLPQMQIDQKQKLLENSGSKNRLFLLSYTLTWQSSTFLEEINSLHNLTRGASRTLADFVDENDENLQINIIFVDYCSEARVTDVAIYANEKKFKKDYLNNITIVS